MARNSTEKAEKAETSASDNRIRQTLAQQRQKFTESTQAALKTASEMGPYRYKSSNTEISRFVNYLKDRLAYWEQKKEQTYHAQRMFDKTSILLSKIDV